MQSNSNKQRTAIPVNNFITSEELFLWKIYTASNIFDSKNKWDIRVRKTVYYILFSSYMFTLLHNKIYKKNNGNIFFHFPLLQYEV